jgi:protein phosphatase PTC1
LEPGRATQSVSIPHIKRRHGQANNKTGTGQPYITINLTHGKSAEGIQTAQSKPNLCLQAPFITKSQNLQNLQWQQQLEALSSRLSQSSVSSRDTQGEISKVAGSKRRSFSSQGGLLNRMFGSSGSPPKEGGLDGSSESRAGAVNSSTTKATDTPNIAKSAEESGGGEKRSGNGSPQGRPSGDNGTTGEKKRRSSGVGGKASSFLQSAKSSLHFSQSPNSAGFMRGSDPNTQTQTPLQKLGKQDPALSVPQGQHNNSAGESIPGPRSTFTVGVWEDRNKKCRRTMEDTHAFLYNFLHTPAPALGADPAASQKSTKSSEELALTESTPSLVPESSASEMMETDNGYFAIFDGHAGTFAADWCGKKLHIILEETIRKNPNTPIPELLDQTFTTVDAQLEKLPLKNSGCTAVTAVLRWEDRIPNAQSATGSTAIAPATAAAVKAAENDEKSGDSGVDMSKTPSQQLNAAASTAASASASSEAINAKLKIHASRQRVLYTANVGDARIVLCRNGKALRLSYDHKGSDENEGKRVANAGGLILNNRVNGVLAVTRALGDAYMKDLVTGHPYTTETVIQADLDEFIILACDGVSLPNLSLTEMCTNYYF